MTLVLEGKTPSLKIREEIKREIAEYTSQGFRRPGLAVILVGNDPASRIYVRNKIKACRDVGIESFFYHLDDRVTTEELLDVIADLNTREEVDGILVQLPLPAHIDQNEIITFINPEKDVDGFHPQNMGKLVARTEDGFIPCTPLGVDLLLKHYGVEVKGKDVVIVGEGFIVGRPLSLLMLWRGATVTVCHIHTRDISRFTREAEILISATGVPHLIKADMVREGAVVIDIGISKVGGKVVGDVDFESVKNKVSAITPVPGGVGPMTVTSLLLNTLKSYRRRMKVSKRQTVP
ncbi:MAG: bifunctional methylenetetrahydrofolate dehydrogenase/methenyltetrahydrofolate cyclohydrolase FolD [Aquificota bacterium]|nr:bifunctional methylenetetrahydrofolate dehydrogenase/methenyltetrahydrofolate cyclohydrolase FolD [Aquificota bacterium]